ncbi:glucosamine-6-phosphate N-acetyltransferase [Klebsormidium nitens]|uniref:Glucosamine 6-phosphate N-acetyltransferase n=1 Tax=Klebsormidium nitens TaxID=105231 RepID=A0A1Y1IH87_KLENI|nr:glucosamine-6-phosphate N-acetyltransferase [Klebsormidium nitens]|eukprot:GAQ87498.1 glucosamine-6-phosphate N-acetyltransferase [Klebsormidium nitens]
MMAGEELITRRLEAGDFHKGYMGLLAQLTVAGDVTEEAFKARVEEMAARAPDYHTVVIEDSAASRVVATATLLIERKILRNCGKCGHVEDVVVDKDVRGKHLGQKLINELIRIAQEQGCYKVILDCADYNTSFYEKSGFVKKEIQMVKYF